MAPSACLFSGPGPGPGPGSTTSIPNLVVVVDKFAEQGIGGSIAAGGGRGAAGGAARRPVLHIPQEAMPEVHGAEALHPSLQIAIDRTTVREWLVHQLLLVALFALVGQDVQAAGGDRSKTDRNGISSGFHQGIQIRFLVAGFWTGKGEGVVSD